VCSSVNDQARVHELGADFCLVHPLTYDRFLAALTATSGQSSLQRQARRPSSAQT
jgi:DNA-binding response OmpR family regulator